MKRMGRASASLTVIGLLLTACSDSGTKTLSENDFVDELNSICNDAGRDIRRLDPSDRRFFDDVLEIIQTGSDDLQKLKPPQDLENDFNDFVDNLDDQVRETENLQQAVDDEDADGVAAAEEDLTSLVADGNDLADSLGAEDCIDVGADGSGPVTTDSVPDETTPNTPLPIDTTPDITADTTPDTSAPPITNPPPTSPPATTAETVPEMTLPPGTGDGLALDASLDFAPPPGYEWTPLQDLAGVSTPFADPVLAPVLTGYWAGRIDNQATGQFALVFISEVSSEWTAEQLEALFDFEGVLNTTDTHTAGGLLARVRTGVGSEAQFDIGLILLATNSVSIITPTGSDVLATLDAFFTANSMGG